MRIMQHEQKPAPPIDPRLYRRVMGRFATGVAVVSTVLDGEVHCMTVNAFMSGSLDPPLCVISVAGRARMHAILQRTRHFAVNVLGEDHELYSRHFSGSPVEGLTPSFEYVEGTPLLAKRLAAIAARVSGTHTCGDHSLFLGEIFHMSAEAKGEPLLFYGGQYAALVHPARLTLHAPEFW